MRLPSTTGTSIRPSFWGRIAPALPLLVLSPLVAGLPLGDLTIRQLYVLVLLLPLYGGGTRLIREITRRTPSRLAALARLAAPTGSSRRA